MKKRKRYCPHAGRGRKKPRAKLFRKIAERRHVEPGQAKPLIGFYGLLPRGTDEDAPKIPYRNKQRWRRYYSYSRMWRTAWQHLGNV